MIDTKDIEQSELALDDTFTFECKGCGECCHNRHDILLPPYDIYRVSKCLRITPQKLFERYCETYIGQESHIPIIRLKPKTPAKLSTRQRQAGIKVCPLLQNNKCIAHKLKPVLCALFPLGRFHRLETKTGQSTSAYFLAKGSACRGRVSQSKSYTVKKWLKMFNIPEHDRFPEIWGDIFSRTMEIVTDVKPLPKEQLLEIYHVFLMLVYLNYDYNEDFVPQLESNAAKFIEIADGIRHHERFQ